MTAIVAVLNKHGAAIAADSAVTLGDTHKVINNGNKVFTLSKYEPVGIATYGNASFMGIPWEIIIKTYRKQLNEHKFPKLSDYFTDFLKYVRNCRIIKDSDKDEDILNNMMVYYNQVVSQLTSKCGHMPSIEEIVAKFQFILDINKKDPNVCLELSDYTLDRFTQDYKGVIDTFLKAIDEHYTEDQANILIESYFYYLRLFLNESNRSGLVFVGYGEGEIYPTLISIEISRLISDRIKYINKESVVIGEDAGASITPFAQVDVCHTIIRGMTPLFQGLLYNIFKANASKIISTIADALDKNGISNVITTNLRSIDVEAVSKQFVDSFEEEKRKIYTNPLLNTIIALNKEDLASLAESLVSLTSVVRRISPSEETVGGPIDVAIISKGDGFIWKNRKHYFDPNLNTHFFDNYFRS